MHRELRQQLIQYEKLARRRFKRECEPRFLATRLEAATQLQTVPQPRSQGRGFYIGSAFLL